jgi:hypothetical protein
MWEGVIWREGEGGMDRATKFDIFARRMASPLFASRGGRMVRMYFTESVGTVCGEFFYF